MKIYTGSELQQVLSTLNGWVIKDDAIEKTFLLGDFKQAMGFMVQVALFAEQANHHPELLNVYNKVVIRLSTHDANAITSKDIELAMKIDSIQ
jgi:4a-hydroxytetrahydrobiopterin dehydratase